jgi:hypothetical protein
MAQSGMADRQGRDWSGVTTKSIPWSGASRDGGVAGVRPYNVNVFDTRQCMASINNPWCRHCWPQTPCRTEPEPF